MPYLIPDVIDPATRVCIPISVPNDPQHLQVFWGHLGLLGKWYSWERDEAHTGKDVAAVWGQTWIEARNSWALGGCMAIYNLRQTNILIERQNEAGGAWTTLYDPRSYVILKAPDTTYQNTVIAPAGVRGLYLRQAGGEYSFVAGQEGTTGAGALIALSNASNTSPVFLLERPTSNGDYLQARVNGSWNTIINRYGQITSIIYAANLPTANSFTLGSIIYLSGSANPSTFPDGAYIGSFIISGGEPVYYWARFKGDTGGTGSDGLPALMSIGTVTTRLPNQAPTASLTPSAGNNYALNLGLPRAAAFSLADTVVRKPNENPTVALTSDTNGDKILQLGLPRMFTLDIYPPSKVAPNATISAYIDTDANGDKKFGFSVPRAQKIIAMDATALPAGDEPTATYTENSAGDLSVTLGIPAASGGGGGGFDDVLPAFGESKIFSMLVPADTWFNLPFRVPADSAIDQITAQGYWTIHTATNDLVVGAAGTEILGVTEGNLRIGKKTDQLTGHFAYEDAVGTHSFFEDTWVSFEMQKYYPTSFGFGWLWVSYRLTRGGAVTIIGVYDFEVGEQGWHAVDETEAGTIGFGNEWGGEWRADGSWGNGWRPTANYHEGWNCTIMSPLATVPFTLTGLQFYYDNLPSSGMLYAWVYHDTSGWHLMGNQNVSAASGSPSVTGLSIANVDRIALITTSYTHAGTTDWRLRKAIITGT